MPSFKSRLVAFVLKHTRKKSFRSPEALARRIAASRKTEDHRPPKAVAAAMRIVESAIDGFPVYEVSPGAETGARRILYLHGGAYCFQMTPFHWKLVAEMATRLRCRVTVPIYPLAPEHGFHDIFGMAMALYRRLLDETPAGDIVFMGDSAGGNMALVMTMMAAKEGLPTPSRLVLLSPGLDMTLANPEVQAVARVDPWLDIAGGLEAVRLYAAGIDFADWRISPLYGDLAVLPPTIVFSGTRDLLYPDTKLFARKAREAGAEVELVVGDGMFHVWPLIDMPEARVARDRIVAWLGEVAPPVLRTVQSA